MVQYDERDQRTREIDEIKANPELGEKLITLIASSAYRQEWHRGSIIDEVCDAVPWSRPTVEYFVAEYVHFAMKRLGGIVDDQEDQDE